MLNVELITRLCNLLDTIEDASQESFDDGEIEDLILEAGIPITRSNGKEG